MHQDKQKHVTHQSEGTLLKLLLPLDLDFSDGDILVLEGRHIKRGC